MAAPQPSTYNTPSTQVSSLRQGQQLDKQTGITQPFTEQDMQVALAEPLVGTANVEITPSDRNSSLVRTYVIPSADILAFSRTFLTTGAVELPETLSTPTAVFETNSGEGASSETATGASVGSNPNLSLSISSSAQSSAALLPDLQILIQPHAQSNMPLTKVLFYSAEGDTMADILTRLAAIMGVTVLAWPKFDSSKKPIAFTLKGQNASIAAGATVKESVSAGDTDTYIQSTGTSDSYSIGSSIKTINVPPTIHTGITISGPTASDTIDATAEAIMDSAPGWTGLSSTETATATVAASVSPSSVAATSPVSAIPSSGLYLYHLDGELSPYAGYATQYAVIFNFSDL